MNKEGLIKKLQILDYSGVAVSLTIDFLGINEVANRSFLILLSLTGSQFSDCFPETLLFQC
jgi:hypothetical protein